MKKSHKKKTEINLLIPAVIDNIIPIEQTDCFAKEWEARDNDCQICADETLCSIVYTEKVKDKKLTFEIMNGPLLDSTDFKGVDMARIERLAKKYEEEGEPMTFEELQQIIQGEANTKDTEAIIQFIKRELPLTKIYLKEGVCRVR